MSRDSHQREREDTYALDPEDTAEMLRLMNQDRLVTQGMGGLFPELDNQLPKGYERIIDIGCGPGNWVLNVAYEYPEVEVVGLDVSKRMIKYAHTQAQTEGRENAIFMEGNVLKQLPFPDNSFDLVNARFMVGVIMRDVWPQVMEELYRIVRPGGIIRLTEPDDMGTSNSLALEELMCFAAMALHQLGYGFSPHGRSFGITPLLGKFLHDAGCEQIQHRPHAFDFSYGTTFNQSQYENWRSGFMSLLPLFKKCNLTTDEEFQILYERMQQEMLSENFRALWYMLTAWGIKPFKLEEAAFQVAEEAIKHKESQPLVEAIAEI
ncbi:hypothetical protein KSD_90480 [Ktedonobacter sp. SOSP1-85]|uniref:class I SAM-dependent methyltransferase n=1 Tax=Ktedonobacter sp. SOSP1-85 TaxID=2778367 RepID=UPI001A192DDC|nr:class I SAM-dependent methyltransferase [Ktedonobacter sp. SOSP1-85]GHO81277.1 hypothetical protein KSD_90480 [Ktedonobacter sp. SOSP1-85]